MKYSLIIKTLAMACISFVAYAGVVMEINLGEEIDLKNGSYLAKEYGGKNKYALINHSHGRFESGDVAIAECKEGFIVSKLPNKFKYISKYIKSTDFVFLHCTESN